MKTWRVTVCLMVMAVCQGVHSIGPLRQQFPRVEKPMYQPGVDPGSPLFLTPYIMKGEIQTAQKLSMVTGLPGYQGKSYSGFLTVDSKYNSNMFFWYFPTQASPSAPLMLWLQGGPGGSSLFGLFLENGPILVNKDMKLELRQYGWTNKYSMLYIDNPVGTGFSFTDSDQGYSRNETHIAENLYNALTQFFMLFPEIKKNPFYITGESYAGKYVPAIAYKILQEGPASKVPLSGIAVGDGFSDPEVMLLQYADYIYNIGMFDENQRDFFQAKSKQAATLIQQGKYIEAFKLWNNLLNGDQEKVPSFFFNATGSTNYYNYLLCNAPPEFGYYGQFLAMPIVRRAIHVGNLTYNNGDKVETMLTNDIMQSVKPWLAYVMDSTKVMLYSGQLDIIVAAPLTEAMLLTVPWKGLPEYRSAPKQVWKVDPSDPEVAGYVRVVDNFVQVIVRGGGHILPYDQPRRSFHMIDKFITDQKFW